MATRWTCASVEGHSPWIRVQSLEIAARVYGTEYGDRDSMSVVPCKIVP